MRQQTFARRMAEGPAHAPHAVAGGEPAHDLRSHEQQQLRMHTAAPAMPFLPSHGNRGVESGGGSHGQSAHDGRETSQMRVPAAGKLANPRRVTSARSMHPPVVSHRPQPLSWRSGAQKPHAGLPGKARAGILDPGGYVRTPQKSAAFMPRDQFNRGLSSMHNHSALSAANNRFRNGNIGSWAQPWSPCPGWQTFGGLWNPCGLGYYDNFVWDGLPYPDDYYALADYAPTNYVFDVLSGLFYDAGVGYVDYLPPGYSAPVTVAVREVVPDYGFWGNIVGYRQESFYYNAVWDPNVQSYGYYDYRGGFHWVTFPWLNSWMGDRLP
jgi:hypothetical protein